MSAVNCVWFRVYGALVLLCCGVSSLFSQTTHIWTGNLSFSWNSSDNWSTGSIPAQGDYLIFTGENNYADDGGLWNDIPLSGDPSGLHPIRLRRITFDENASAFVLGGETFRVGGWIYNDSDHVQTIEAMELQVVNGGGVIPNSQNGSAEGLVVDVGDAGMVIYSDVTTANTAWNFVKDGAGLLTLTGNNVTYGTIVNEGGLIQNGGSLGVGNNSRLVLGSGWAMNEPDAFASAYVEYTGGATGTWTNIIARKFSGTNVVRVDGGSTVTVSGLLVNAGNSFPSPTFASYTTDGQAVLLFDLTGGGEVILNQANYAGLGMLSQHGHYVLVQESTVDGVKTGFGYVDADNGNRLTRVTSHLTALPENPDRALSGSVNYVTSGHVVSGEISFGRIVGNTLTIRPNTNPLDSTGSLSSWSTNVDNAALRISSLLMEEGTGDYAIDARWEPNPAIQRNTAFIHQYSTDGTLYFMRGFAMSSFTAVRIVKTGPGTVVYHKDGLNSVHQTLTDIQGGRFVLDGYHGSVEYFYIRGAGSILSGEGGIGGSEVSGNPRYSWVQVFDGGTIEADNHEKKALDITGSLTIADGGAFRKALHESPEYDPLYVKGTDTAAEVNLAGNLELSLHYAPSLYEWIVLLTTDGSITGVFDTINGTPFLGHGNDLFTLNYGLDLYSFLIAYDHDLGGGVTAVVLQSIPEPATVACWMAVFGLGLVCWRKRKQHRI